MRAGLACVEGRGAHGISGSGTVVSLRQGEGPRWNEGPRRNEDPRLNRRGYATLSVVSRASSNWLA